MNWKSLLLALLSTILSAIAGDNYERLAGPADTLAGPLDYLANVGLPALGAIASIGGAWWLGNPKSGSATTPRVVRVDTGNVSLSAKLTGAAANDPEGNRLLGAWIQHLSSKGGQ